MRMVQFVAVFATLVILLSATIADNIVDITRRLSNIPQYLYIFQRDTIFKTEIIGLIVGTVILFAILPILLRTNQSNVKTSL